MNDLIVIGAGPAGITASVYAARKRMNCLIITGDIGGQTILSSDIENYTGYHFITGVELAQKFREHLEQFKLELKVGDKVNLVKHEDGIVQVRTEKGEYQAKTLIIASGRIPRKLGVEGEDEFKNRGVTYCATCDAPLFSEMDVAVVGGGNSALDATLQLMKIANKIYLVDVADRLRADPIMVEKAKGSNKVIIYNNAKVKQISGDKFVQGIKIERDGKEEDLTVGGIFIEIGSTPASEFVKDVAKNETGEIFVNCRCETNISGIFAAGDVTDVPAKQIIVACGEGAKASLSAFDYISRL
ncbi:MAG: FAD-dependent oxidoreductase [Deltaproteobacteria bacterium]|nr:MAG: FAD-dependent oxidoreductase [Deltaproteobacteria bacterium]